MRGAEGAWVHTLLGVRSNADLHSFTAEHTRSERV
jgi:hypothetical protein